MTEPGDMEKRLRRVEQDAAAARVLAGGADRDVQQLRAEMREFRAQNLRLHNATREDIVDLRAEMRAGFAGVESRFAAVDHGFIEMRGKLDATAAGMQTIVDLLTEKGA